MNVFNNLPIKYKLFISYVILFLVVISASFSVLYVQLKNRLETRIHYDLKQSNSLIRDMIQTATAVSIKNHLKAIAEKNLEIVQSLHGEAALGSVTEAQAKAMAAKLMGIQTIGKTGYIYCIDTQGLAAVHPEKSIQGASLIHHAFIRQQIATKTGYMTYDWRNPGEENPRAKALYMVYYEPWDWIISVSSYREEFTTLISMDDLRERVLALKPCENGFSFVFDINGTSIIHPFISHDFYDFKDAAGIPIFKQMIAERSGQMLYSCREPQEMIPRQKYLTYDFLPDLGWIIASSSYVDDIYTPLNRMKTLILFILIVTVGLTGLMTLMLSQTITRPLTGLIRQFERGASGDWSARMPAVREDEIGKLAQSFNTFMETITTTNETLRDEIAVRRETESQLRLFEKVFENADEGICITGTDGTIKSVNTAFERITGYNKSEVVGKNPRVLKSDRHDPEFYNAMWKSIVTTGQWSGEIWNRRKSGEAYPELLSISAITNTDGRVSHYVSVFHDISEIKSKEEQIRYMAYHDPLTGLPNRVLLRDRLRKAILKSVRTQDIILVIYVDLDNFKDINDTIGHANGDRILRQVADRMQLYLRHGDTISRLGGDEFVIMITEIESEYEIARIIERIQKVFQSPFHLDGKDFHITGSIGLAMFPRDGETPDDLIKNADLAMYQSKNRGKNMYHSFTPEMEERIQLKLRLEIDMRAALDNNEFQVFFQPKVHNQTLGIMGMEALVRWIKPDGEIIAPNVFIPFAEESGLIVPLGEQVLVIALKHASAIMRQTGMNLKLSVNLSPKQFEHDGFQEMVTRSLVENGYPPGNLEFEITETLLMKDMSITMPRLEWLKSMGITMAIDDFGTGYSSLAYLKRLPISVLKIDKSFIDDIPDDKESLVLVETIALMGRNLNISLVAEGVETTRQLEVLNTFGAMEIQGYLFSPPLPRDRFLEYLLSHGKNPSEPDPG